MNGKLLFVFYDLSLVLECFNVKGMLVIIMIGGGLSRERAVFVERCVVEGGTLGIIKRMDIS